MAVRISAKNSKLSDTSKEYIEKVCDKLRQFYDRIIDCEVVIERSKHGNEVEIIVKVPQQTFVGSAEAPEDNLFKAVDDAGAKVETQLKRYHDKQVEHR
jgi:ribosomal subunit interface protein